MFHKTNESPHDGSVQRRHVESSSSRNPPASNLECFTGTNGVLTTTMMDVPGYRVVKVLGVVYGITVRSRNAAASLGMEFKAWVGGELKWYTTLLYNARNDAIGRLAKECQKRGGNAIISLRFDQEGFGGFAQVCAYGTACLVEKIDKKTELPMCPQLSSHAQA